MSRGLLGKSTFLCNPFIYCTHIIHSALFSSVEEPFAMEPSTGIPEAHPVAESEVGPRPSDASEPLVTTDTEECLAILKAAPVERLGLFNQPKRNKSRATPNQRLVTAFGIENCFTTPDPNICYLFRKKVELRLHMKEDEWATLARRVQLVVQDEFQRDRNHLSLFQVVQMITLKAVLDPLFKFDISRRDADASIQELAAEINEQWLRSKGPVDSITEPSWAFKHQTRLQQALKLVLPEFDANISKDDPLNLLLPGYETMWRVVLRCFLELTARGHPDGPVWCKILQAFGDNPTLAQLDDSSDGTSTAQITKEILRLYPPTRRVYREYEGLDGKAQIVAANIEACHRDEAIWGPRPQCFIPTRWHGKETKENENQTFLAFSTHPFTCPARRRFVDDDEITHLPFGHTMIALLAAELVTQTMGKWKVVGGLPGQDEPLDTERKAYDDLRLERL